MESKKPGSNQRFLSIVECAIRWHGQCAKAIAGVELTQRYQGVFLTNVAAIFHLSLRRKEEATEEGG